MTLFRRWIVNADSSDTDNSDEFEGNQVLTVPFLRSSSLNFWGGLLNEKARVGVTFSLGFTSSGKACFVVSSHKETVKDLWRAHSELKPLLKALAIHDELLSFNGPLGQSRSRRVH